MFADDGRKEETRGAGRQLLLRGWVLLSLTWGRVCRATVSAEQDGNKGAGWSAGRGGSWSEDWRGGRQPRSSHWPAGAPGGQVGGCNRVHGDCTALPSAWSPPRPQPHGGNMENSLPFLAHDGHAQERRFGSRVGARSQWTDGAG